MIDSAEKSGMKALLTDLYQLTMAAGYFHAGKVSDVATFQLSIRRLPRNRNYLLAAGLQQALEYLLALRFSSEELDYLRTLPVFHKCGKEFFDFLSEVRFTGEVWALPEGTPFFAGEPVLTVRAPIVEAQLVETYLLSTIAFQNLMASKVAGVVRAAYERRSSDDASGPAMLLPDTATAFLFSAQRRIPW